MHERLRIQNYVCYVCVVILISDHELQHAYMCSKYFACESKVTYILYLFNINAYLAARYFLRS